MKTVREFVPESTLEEFADRHGLVMRVVERSAETIAYWRGDCFRFYANFDGAEVGEGSILASASGNGNTEADAIRDYGVRISEKLLIVDAMKPTRREIRVPRIVGSPMSAKTFGERFREEFRAWASEAFRDPHDWHVADEAFDYIAGVLILDCAGEDAKSCIVPISLIPDVGGPKMREIDEDATLARIASALLRARGEENEAAAKECERCGREWDDDANRPPLGQRSINSAFMASGALKCAAAIRARRNR